MGAALASGLIATASYTTLQLGYEHGGRNLDYWFRDVNDCALPFDEYIGRRLLSPSPIFYPGFLYTGLGVGIVVLMMALRSRLPWWPLHPVALPVSTIAYTHNYSFSVFLAWGIKSLVLRFGGANLYRMTRPFFMGIILGEGGLPGDVDRHRQHHGQSGRDLDPATVSVETWRASNEAG